MHLLLRFLFLTSVLAGAASGFAKSFFLEKNAVPMRLPLIKLSPSLDRVKPLGIVDYAGWVLVNDTIIGTIEDGWVGAMTVPHRRPIWWIQDQHTPLSSPTFLGTDFVVFGFHDGELRKVDIKTGATLWKQKVVLDAYPARKIALYEGSLLVVTAAQSLYRINVDTGAIEWVYEAGYPHSVSVRNLSAPVYHSNTVYYGLANGEIAAVHYSTGAFVWRKNPYPIQAKFNDIIGEMDIAQDVLVFTRVDGLALGLSVAANAGSLGEQKWAEAVRLPAISTSYLFQGIYYVGSANGLITALEANSGRKLWERMTVRGPVQIFGGEHSLFVVSGEGAISVLDPNKQGNLKWQDDLHANVYSSPIFSGSDFYLPTSLRVLYGYKVTTL